MVTYQSFEIFEYNPEQAIDFSINNPFLMVGEPWQHQTKFTNEAPERMVDVVLLMNGVTERASMRDFFDSKKGKETAFWIKSKKADMVVSEAIGSGNSTIKLVPSEEIFGLSNVTRHVWIPSIDQLTKVSNPQIADGGDTITIDLDPALSGDLKAGAKIHNLYLVRFDSDTFGIRGTRINEAVTECEFRLRELQGETP